VTTGQLSIAVIGCGIIGSRHAQALAALKRPAILYLTDTSSAARAAAKNLMFQSGGTDFDLQIAEAATAGSLPPALDVAIVATVAAARRQVIEELLNGRNVRFLILEKFLFQSNEDFAWAGAAIRRAGVHAYVNCPRRLWPGYVGLRRTLVEEGGPVALSCTTHARFGIGTTAIHLLDLLAYLSGTLDFDMSYALVDPEPLPHRSGGVDFSGSLLGKSKCGDVFRYTAFRDGTLPVGITIEAPSLRAHVDESRKIIRLSRRDTGWTWESLPFETPFQSQLTHAVVEDLTARGSCGLTPYNESARLHLAILEPLLAHYRKHADPHALSCPIT
jgi:predicted dehydrogenase